MSKSTRIIITLIHSLTLTTFLTIGCSIAEQRSGCPCWVGLDFSKVLAQENLRNGSPGSIDLTIYDTGGNVAYSHSYGLDSCASLYEIEIPRGQYTLSAVVGSTGIGPDRQAGPLYGNALHLDAEGEYAEAVAEPFKQFADIDIKIISSPYDSLDISLTAASAAVDKRSLEGLKEQYSCSRTVSDGTALFSILRQAGGEVQLSFSEALTGNHITDIDLGAWLKEIGYDFSADNLADIVLILDFHNGTASLSIAGWLDAPAYFIIF